VGEPGDDVLEAAHLLIEIGAKAGKLLLVAQLLGLDDFVETRRERLVVRLRSELPIAPPGRSEHAFAEVVAGDGFFLAGLHLLSAAFGRSILGFFAAHLDIAAAGSAFLPLLGRVLASSIVTLLFLPALFCLIF